MSVTGEPDGDPVRVGTSIVDLGTGMWIAVAVLGALMERERTGRGCHVTASLLDTSLAWMSYHLTSYLATGELPGPMGTSIAMIAPYEAFPCTDGSVMIAAGNDDIFGRLCRALELDLARHPDFATNPARVANRRRLAGIVAAGTRRHTHRGPAGAPPAPHRVPAAPIHTVASALEDPQTAATGMMRSCAHPRRRGLRRYPDADTVGRTPRPVAPPASRCGDEHQGELFPEE